VTSKLLIGVLLAALALPGVAQVHRCKDEAGKTYYSDRGCAGGEQMRGAPGGASHTIGTAADDEGIARRCLDHVRTQKDLGPADALRVEGYRVKTVAVKGVGARRLPWVTGQRRANTNACCGATT
jgi:hypothetical protein